jgi:phosphate-selective porin OprO and OprP
MSSIYVGLLVIVVGGMPVSLLAVDEKPGVTAGADGFSIRSADGAYKLQLRSYVHFDGRFYPADENGVATDTFLLRRARPILQGTIAKHFDFQLTTDFGGGSPTVQDAWVDANYSAKLRVRVGKFKSPVGLDRLKSATAMTFIERAFPTSLVPNRDIGIQAHGEVAKGRLAYAIALLDGAPDGGSVDLDANDGKDVAGRIFVSPFKGGESVLRGLSFGVSATSGRQSGTLPSYRSAGQVVIVAPRSGVVADGNRKRLSPQLSLYSGPVEVIAEYARSKSQVRRPDATHSEWKATAWQAAASVALTGEDASFSGRQPKSPFDPAKGQWGALELAARINGLEIDPSSVDAALIDTGVSARKAFAWGLGVNWILSRNVKQSFSFERTTFTAGAASGADRRPENAVFIRTQIAF